jgi:voltage-gated sodium channel
MWRQTTPMAQAARDEAVLSFEVWVTQAFAAERARIAELLLKRDKAFLAELQRGWRKYLVPATGLHVPVAPWSTDGFAAVGDSRPRENSSAEVERTSMTELERTAAVAKENLPQYSDTNVDVDHFRVNPRVVGNVWQNEVRVRQDATLKQDIGQGSVKPDDKVKDLECVVLEDSYEEVTLSPLTKNRAANRKPNDPVKDEDGSADLAPMGATMAFFQNSFNSFMSEEREKGFFMALIDSPWFEAFFVSLVLVNTVVACMEAQYRGFDIGFQLDYPGVAGDAETTWPNAKRNFEIAEIVFAVLYTIELVSKLLALHLAFFKDCWNIFDLFLVSIWYIVEFAGEGSLLNPLVLRVCRLARLMRLVRHAGWLSSFDSLHMLISAIKASFSVLVWATIILLILLVIVALAMNGNLVDYMEDLDKPRAKRAEVYLYFGTFTRSLISIFEISFANHVAVTRTVMENVEEYYAIYFLLYKCVVGLSVFNVVIGVFLHETFKVCSEDDELMIIQKRRTQKEHIRKMNRLFSKVDESGDGLLSKDEFEKVMKDEWVHTWLSAMDLDISHVDRLWELVDDGDGNVTADELVEGVSKLKGAAKSVDLNHMAFEFQALKAVVEDVRADIRNMDTKMVRKISKISNSESDLAKLDHEDTAKSAL